MKKFILLLLLPVFVFAQSPDELMERVQNNFKSIRNLQAGFVQSTHSQMSDAVYSQSGKFYYKTDNQYRIEFGNQIIISDGETLWNYDENLKRVIINIIENDPAAFSIERYIMEYPGKCDLSFAQDMEIDSTIMVVELKPVTEELEFKNAKMWIDESDMVYKFEITDYYDNIFSFELNDLLHNRSLADSIFNFNPPKGTQIIDLR